MSRLDERIIAITNSILSGVNACETLKKSIDDGTIGDYIQEMIRPTLEIYEEEYAQVYRDWVRVSGQNDLKRFALEAVISNNGNLKDTFVMDAIRKALPGRI